jgi:carboxyl-terminal processing protease
MRGLCSFIIALSAVTRVPDVRCDDATFLPGEAMRAAVNALERHSLTRKRLDASMSSRWLGTFLDRLDPKRMYFLKADEVEFRRFESRLPDLARAGDFGFPLQLRERYRKRVGDAATYADECLSIRHDYSLDEKYPVHFGSYATDAAELRERWRLRIKFELLIEKVHGVAAKDAEAQLCGRYMRIARQAREMNDERLCEVYLDSLAVCFDPHSGYLSPEFVDSFQGGLLRTYTLGLSLRETLGEYVITSVHHALLPPAAHELVGWHLLAIRRIGGPTYDLVAINHVDLYNLIRLGPFEQDTKVILELMNPTTLARKTVTWVRFPSN